jgi:hypothetical protein
MSHDALAALDLATGLSGNHRSTLMRLFQHPLSHNLSWREVTRLFASIGAAENQHNGDLVFQIGNEHLSIKSPHGKDLGATEVMDLRHLLLRAGWSPEGLHPTIQTALGDLDLMIVIDHAGARLYQFGNADGIAQSAAPHETHHLVHHFKRNTHDEDRSETYPSDTAFFDGIAAAATGHGRIVVIGHGSGQSNEADHLIAYLSDHRPAVHARIVRVLLADLAKLTSPQLAELARQTLHFKPNTNAE